MELENPNQTKPELEGNVKLISNENIKQIGSDINEPKPLEPFLHSKTLDEPIRQTIFRDLKMILYKLKYVLLPKMREERGRELRRWDLWGPLVLCLLLALTISFATNTESKTIFATIFFIIWVGGAIVTANAKFLKGKISFFQTICVLGYCVCPLNIASLLLVVLKEIIPLWAKILIVCGFTLWSIISSVGFMSSLVEENKKLMAVYPVCLYYVFLGWYVLAI